MSLFDIVAVLLVLAAVFSYVNFKWLGLPTTIGVMLMSLVLSLAILFSGALFPSLRQSAEGFLGSIDFNETLLQGMLGFLLFAGALHVDLERLRAQGLGIGLLATIGTLLTAALVAGITWGATRLLGIDLSLVHCLLFGSLIAPTDPIAVLGLLESIHAPKALETIFAGESLFNDGVGVVLFVIVLEVATAQAPGSTAVAPDAAKVLVLFVREALGGAAFGFVTGWVAYRMLKSMDEYKIEVLITLALVTGGYAAANALHVSGPIAMVVAGVLLGNHGRAFAMSDLTREHLDGFWELVDMVLNAVLFLLIGMEVMVITVRGEYLLAGAVAVPAVLFARFVAVGVPATALRLLRPFPSHGVKVLTWGGLRGGISVALALSLRDRFPRGAERTGVDEIITMTYVVVVFSILVQGLTIGRVVRRYLHPEEDVPAAPSPG